MKTTGLSIPLPDGETLRVESSRNRQWALGIRKQRDGRKPHIAKPTYHKTLIGALRAAKDRYVWESGAEGIEALIEACNAFDRAVSPLIEIRDPFSVVVTLEE